MAGKKKTVDEGSAEARRRASVVLEVLGGLRTPSEACELIGVTLARYYALETQGIAGLVKALEPKGRGGRRGPRPETQIARLTEERDRLAHELQRSQALVRIAQRAVGLPSAEAQRKKRQKKRKAAGKKKRERKPTVRARRAAERLRSNSDPAEARTKAPGSANAPVTPTPKAEAKRA